jgi:para-nitrobenzyl esterase
MVEVETTLGTIRGMRNDLVDVFRGVPYAAAPVGGLRFRGPRPSSAWPEVRDATRFGPPAPQNPDPLDHI